MRFFLTGFMGCGKTFWARQWSQASGLKCYDLDHEIEQRERQSVTALFKERGEDAFRLLERDTLRTFLKLDNYIMSCGGGTPCFFDNMERMNAAGITIYLKSSVPELVERLRQEKETRPLIRDVSGELLDEFITARLELRRGCYSQSMFHLHTRHLSNENFERIYRRYAK
ncbi:MAG TPA: shikimate kinase [Lacibacter sp.]|nr:shikimate kinase [Lacibacter sp.]HMO90366.1 shikimate kinase [Lacibacter sp.]HMP87444.1 shikimate kinase [Lacibacter sp.]